MSAHRTTETLRDLLFNAIDKTINGDITPADARNVALLADKIIDTARLELQYSETVSRLDQQGQGVSTGPVLLTGKTEQ